MGTSFLVPQSLVSQKMSTTALQTIKIGAYPNWLSAPWSDGWTSPPLPYWAHQKLRFLAKKAIFSLKEHSCTAYISAPEKKIEKTEGILFSFTLKVWESKVLLVLTIFSQGLIYGHFLNSTMASVWCRW